MPKSKRRVLKTKKTPKSSSNTLLRNIVKFSTGAWLWHSNSLPTSAISPGLALIQNQLPDTTTSSKPAPEKPDIIARNILGYEYRICYTKELGISQGRKCEIYDQTYFMKNANTQTNFRFQEAYNLLFLRNVLNINIPQFGYLLDAKLFFATIQVPSFIMAVTLLSKGPDFRNQVSSVISGGDIAKLAVARTFIADLTKLENWGYTPDGLVIIDADGGLRDDGSTMMPKNAEEYFKLASESMGTTEFSAPFHYGFELNLDNILQMKSIYEQMRFQKLPDVDPSVNLDKALYATVLNVYIKTCDSILLQFSAYNKETPSVDINKAFAKAVLTEGLLINPKGQVSGTSKSATAYEMGKSALLSAAQHFENVVAASTAIPAIQHFSSHTVPKLIVSAVKNQQKTFLKKTEVELQDMIIPSLIVASGTTISALAIIYVLWKKYNELPANSATNPQLFTRAPSNTSVKISITTPKNTTQKTSRK